MLTAECGGNVRLCMNDFLMGISKKRQDAVPWVKLRAKRGGGLDPNALITQWTIRILNMIELPRGGLTVTTVFSQLLRAERENSSNYEPTMASKPA